MKDYINNIVNKNVYIVDSENIYYFEDLRKSLINEIKRDTIENREDKDIVESNLNILERVYDINYGYNENWVIRNLVDYGYSIMKLKDLQDNLLTLKTYFKCHENKGQECEYKNDIDKVMEDINNYFKD